MQPHSSIPAPITNGSPARASARMLGALLVLVAIITGSIVVLGRHMPAAAVTALGAPHTLLASCRPCQDEALGSRPSAGAVAQPAGPSIVVGARHTLIMACQPCRDEVLGASPAGITTAQGGVLLPELNDPRQSGRR